MHFPVITAKFAAVFLLALVVLSALVIVRRRALGVAFGDKEDTILRGRIRAHGNFVEYVPVGLLALLLLELQGVDPGELWLLGGLFVLARGLHAAGMLTAVLAMRVVGMVGTLATLVLCAVHLLYI